MITPVTRYVRDVSQMDFHTNTPIPLHRDSQPFTAKEACQIPLQFAMDCFNKLPSSASEGEKDFWMVHRQRADRLITERLLALKQYETDPEGRANVCEGVIHRYTDPFMVWFTSRVICPDDSLRCPWDKQGVLPVPGPRFSMQPDPALLRYFTVEIEIESPVLPAWNLATFHRTLEWLHYWYHTH